MDTMALSYKELAKRLGVKPESARKTAQRKRWHRTVGNDGTARVHVPVDVLSCPSDSPMDNPCDSHPVHELQKRVAVLETELAAMLAKCDDLAADRDRWHAEAQKGFFRRLFGKAA